MRIPIPRRLAPLAALLLVAALAGAGTAAESLLQSVVFRLPGTWRGAGSIGGMPAQVELTWSIAFDGRFLRVHALSRSTNREGSDVSFESEGTVAATPDDTGRRDGMWFDSQGRRHPLVATSAGDSLVTTWVEADGVQGRMVYRLLDATTLQVRDERLRNAEWQTTTVSTLSRAPATPH